MKRASGAATNKMTIAEKFQALVALDILKGVISVDSSWIVVSGAEGGSNFSVFHKVLWVRLLYCVWSSRAGDSTVNTRQLSPRSGSALMDFASARQRSFNVRKHVLFAEKVEEIRLPQKLIGLTTGATQQQRSARRAQPFGQPLQLVQTCSVDSRHIS